MTGRTKILVFNWCYHGSVDETFVVLEQGRPVARAGLDAPDPDAREDEVRALHWLIPAYIFGAAGLLTAAAARSGGPSRVPAALQGSGRLGWRG